MKKLFFSLSCFLFLVINLSFVTATPYAPSVEPSMILYYRLNNNASIGENATHIVDSSFSSFNASNINNSVAVAGGGFLGDGAYSFNGVNQTLNVGSTVLNIDSQPRSYCAWVKLSSVGINQYILAKKPATSPEQGFFVSSSNRLSLIFRNATVNTPVNGATSLAANTYYFVCGTYDHTTGNSTVYVNGMPDGSNIQATGNLTTTANFFVGGRATTTQYLNGTLDDVIVWNKTLSAAEVLLHYDHYTNGCTSQPFDGCALTHSTTFDTGTYLLNGSETGAINISGKGIIVNCNSSVFVGNMVGYGMRVVTDDVSIFGCSFIAYNRSIDTINGNNLSFYNLNVSHSNYGITTRNNNNVSIINSTFLNITTNAIEISTTTSKSNFTVARNTFVDVRDSAVDLLENTYYTEVFNNSFTRVGGNSISFNGVNHSRIFENRMLNASIKSFNGDNVTIFNNTLNNGLLYILVQNSLNTRVFENSVYNSTKLWGINIVNSTNIEVVNNSVNLTDDVGLKFEEYGENLTILDNDVINSYKDGDQFDAAVYFESNRTNPRGFSNVTISDNRIVDFGCVGILVRDANDFFISDNYISQNLTFLLQQNFDCDNEPLMGIMIEEVYKGFVPIGTPPAINLTNLQSHNSSNIIIQNNTFNNINVLLRTQGTNNLTHDLSNYRVHSFRIPSFVDKEIFYVSNDWSNLTGIRPNGTLTNTLQQGRFLVMLVNYSITPTYYQFTNVNTSAQDIQVYNISRSLVSYSNGYNEKVGGFNQQYNITLGTSSNVFVHINNAARLRLSGSSAHIKISGTNQTLSICDW